MRIATWNVERLKHKARLEEIVKTCNSPNADILVLTETDNRIQPEYRYCFSTPALHEIRPDFYDPTENRVSIFTNYELIRRYETYDEYTSICVGLNTPYGEVIVYGTIIGIYGNRHPSFSQDLEGQMADLSRLSALHDGICFCGDFNCSFSDNYYFTNAGREKILATLNSSSVSILTKEQKECIDHIAVSNMLVQGKQVCVEEWNADKDLSDHKGIVVDF